MRKLSPRLCKLYQNLLPHAPIWDLCCDHGYIALNAFEDPTYPEIHAVDIVPTIVNRIKNRLSEHIRESIPPYDAHSFCYKDDNGIFWGHTLAGENVQGLSGSVLIAGVGSETIITILSAHISNKNITRWVLSSHTDKYVLRSFLSQQSEWKLAKEELILEKQHFREILVLERFGQPVNQIWNFVQTESLVRPYLQARLELAQSIEKKGGCPVPSSDEIYLKIQNS